MSEHERPSQSSEWRTPRAIFGALDLKFDLDPCSPIHGPDFVPARRKLTRKEDGLSSPWPPNALIFMNPPWLGRRGQVPWLKKFFAHPGGGIAIVAARTSADWFHDVVVPHAELLCFPNGKTKFIKPDGSVGKEPGTGVAIIAKGPVAVEALRKSGLGVCMTIDRTAKKRN